MASIEQLSARFMNVYANLPLNIRDEVVLVTDNEPVSWNAVYLEVLTGSERAEHMLPILEDLELI